MVTIKCLENILKLFTFNTWEQQFNLSLLQLSRIIFIKEIESLAKRFKRKQSSPWTHSCDKLIKVYFTWVIFIDWQDEFLDFLCIVKLWILLIELFEFFHINDSAFIFINLLENAGQMLSFWLVNFFADEVAFNHRN